MKGEVKCFITSLRFTLRREVNKMPRRFDTLNERGETVKCWRAEKQVYALNDCMISAGVVYEGNEPDTIYLRFEKHGVEPTMVFVRPDEASAIIRCLAGALWSLQMEEMFPPAKKEKAPKVADPWGWEK
jgi:hypothetical protein